MSADFWLGLQQDWDLWHALRSEDAAEIARLQPLCHMS
jgi:plasmid maintenance system antidote protein VapI